MISFKKLKPSKYSIIYFILVIFITLFLLSLGFYPTFILLIMIPVGILILILLDIIKFINEHKHNSNKEEYDKQYISISTDKMGPMGIKNWIMLILAVSAFLLAAAVPQLFNGNFEDFEDPIQKQIEADYGETIKRQLNYDVGIEWLKFWKWFD